MTDYDRHARILGGSELEIVALLGAHEIGTDSRARVGRQAREVYDLITGEPIAILSKSEAVAFAAWLEAERPLPPRTPPRRSMSEAACVRLLADLNEDALPPPWSRVMLEGPT